MGDMGDIFNDWREHKKERREIRLNDANNIDVSQLVGWTKHTSYHWSRKLQGKQLNWWPSTGKWSWASTGSKPKMFFGNQTDLFNFIKNRE